MNSVPPATLSIDIPRELNNEIELTNIFANYSARNILTSYSVDLVCDRLHKHRTVKARDLELLNLKLKPVIAQWAKQLSALQKREAEAESVEKADSMTREANLDVAAIDSLLQATLNVNDAISWERAVRIDRFAAMIDTDSATPIERTSSGRPKAFQSLDKIDQRTSDKIMENRSWLDRLFRKRQIIKRYLVEENERRAGVFEESLAAFEAAQRQVATLKVAYEKAEASAVEEYCDLVLGESSYPDFFPRDWDLEYNPANKSLIVVLDLPAPDQMPTTLSYKFVKSRNVIEPKTLTTTKARAQYNSALYQICIRTLHELFEADVIDAIDQIIFNGRVTQTNPATGIEESKVILSVSAAKSEFVCFDLAKVDPQETFRYLKGITTAQLIDIVAVPPIALPQQTTRMLVQSQDVLRNVDRGTNLAAMDWEDFEHLVRQVFETAYTSETAEVRVTRASADGGIDAIIFDSDPIRGGKIVIQAKRYTNTVGVAAVRELYGSMLDEGAMKGILVTTSDFGPESYEFAKDKPLTLIGGANLVHMMQEQGNAAYIDIGEAKKQLNA